LIGSPGSEDSTPPTLSVPALAGAALLFPLLTPRLMTAPLPEGAPWGAGEPSLLGSVPSLHIDILFVFGSCCFGP
jgi:hypothetical protein